MDEKSIETPSNSVDQDPSEKVIDLDTEKSPLNIMLKIKEKNLDRNCKRKFYLKNGTVMQLESCKFYDGICEKCKCSIECDQCGKRIVNSRYRIGDRFLSKKCLEIYKKSEKYDPSIAIDKVNESEELSTETKDRIQTLLYESKNLNQYWYGATDKTLPHRVSIENIELPQILKLYRYHFVIPKQVTIFSMTE